MMRFLTPDEQQMIDQLAQRYGFSADAVLHMLQAVMNGQGTMAQFHHPEFGGAGQWMPGGMIMLADMFNHGLKTNVDSLCHALANILAQHPEMGRPTHRQAQRQGQQQSSPEHEGPQPYHAGLRGAVSLWVAPAEGPAEAWWSGDLGRPTAVGTQNTVRYAYFRAPRRLAILLNGQVTVYDTLDHQIQGFAQHQSVGGSLTFTSQYGVVDLATLSVVSPPGELQQAEERGVPPGERGTTAPGPRHTPGQPPQGGTPEGDVLTMIERLAALQARGLLSDEEYAAKKADLLRRL
jgi:hypothetical protein